MSCLKERFYDCHDRCSNNTCIVFTSTVVFWKTKSDFSTVDRHSNGSKIVQRIFARPRASGRRRNKRMTVDSGRDGGKSSERRSVLTIDRRRTCIVDLLTKTSRRSKRCRKENCGIGMFARKTLRFTPETKRKTVPRCGEIPVHQRNASSCRREQPARKITTTVLRGTEM